METKSGTDQSYETVPMNGGGGECSYAQNSSTQRRAADVIKNTVRSIFQQLDLQILLRHSSNILRIADLGCSGGPDTFSTAQNIIDVVSLKLQSQVHIIGSKCLEFQVFFNHHHHIGNNDFNTTLFKSIPEEGKQYCTPSSAGSFHGRLFLKSSIHFFNSSYDLHWLSRVPKDIVDKNSPAYNKGSIYFTSEDNKEVAEAYSAQFENDFESFLNYRALELVPGGIMTIIIPCVPPNSVHKIEVIANLIEDILLEMVSKGIISNQVVDSFNLPIYMPTSEEVKEVIEKNGNFEIDGIKELESSSSSVGVIFSNMRQKAVGEVLLRQHFGQEVLDHIFIQLQMTFTRSYTFINDHPCVSQLFIITRNFYLG